MEALERPSKACLKVTYLSLMPPSLEPNTHLVTNSYQEIRAHERPENGGLDSDSCRQGCIFATWA